MIFIQVQRLVLKSSELKRGSGKNKKPIRFQASEGFFTQLCGCVTLLLLKYELNHLKYLCTHFFPPRVIFPPLQCDFVFAFSVAATQKLFQMWQHWAGVNRQSQIITEQTEHNEKWWIMRSGAVLHCEQANVLSWYGNKIRETSFAGCTMNLKMNQC